MAFITKSYQNLFGVRSYINAYINVPIGCAVFRMAIGTLAY